jgi:uncharacterized membrane protein YhiD involved in acid resistance
MRIGQALGLRHEDFVTQERRIEIVPRQENANGQYELYDLPGETFPRDGAQASTDIAHLTALANPAMDVTYDPTRIAAQIVTGVGFLGAGAILRHGTDVRGLTTAATIWVVAAIGMVVGFGNYKIGIFTTALVLVTLVAIRPLERRMFHRQEGRHTEEDHFS